jgi:ribosomal protein S18 acetylase RimI-like enzyme
MNEQARGAKIQDCVHILIKPTSLFNLRPLNIGQEIEVLAFLRQDIIPDLVMRSLILDNGLCSPLNRGTFYACWDVDDRLKGVALIGHAILFSAESEAAISSFAGLAQKQKLAHVVLDTPERLSHFWRYYVSGGQAQRRMCREICFEMSSTISPSRFVPGLRLATLEDLGLILPIQAEMAAAESGVNPLLIDPAGFSQRCARRIEHGRVWVWVEGGQLLFKAEVQAETEEAAYLEGIWVNPQEQNQGRGQDCLLALSTDLLRRKRALYLLVNEQNRRALSFYCRVGFRQCNMYDTIYLSKDL